jgi:hypothetical protein
MFTSPRLMKGLFFTIVSLATSSLGSAQSTPQSAKKDPTATAKKPPATPDQMFVCSTPGQAVSAGAKIDRMMPRERRDTAE